MERFTKISGTLWVCAAVALQSWLLRSWPDLPWLTLAAFVAGVALSRIDRRSVAVVLIVSYTMPALLRWLHGSPSGLFEVLWMAALLGVIVPDALRSGWHIPSRWRATLILALLVTITSATLTIWREIDGTIPLISDFDAVFWHGGELPPFQVQWILNVALTLSIGILWFDWLCGVPDLDFDRAILTPLIVSILLLSMVSGYQTFFDIRFLNETVFSTLDRASGTMYDANVAGALAALWVGGVFIWARRLRGWRLYAAPAVIAACGVAVWSSGSRTALLSATLTLAACVLSLVVSGPGINWRRALAGVAVVALVVGVLVAIGRANPQALNPGARIWATVSSFPTPSAFFTEMWNRNGYGRSAVQLIKQYPLTGIGIGSYYNLSVPVAMKYFHTWTPPDNAQNWLRHQIVEFGFVGGLAWAIWLGTFAWFVLTPRRGEDPLAWTARGMLIAFGLVSMLGMPGQDLMVALTFWTFAFYYIRLKGTALADTPVSRTAWVGIGAVLVVFAVGTVSVSATGLRLPTRARQSEPPFAYTFSYGFGPPDALRDQFRPTIRHAVAIVEPGPQRWLAIQVRRNDGVPSPVDVRIWCEDAVVLKGRLSDPHTLEAYVPVEANSKVLLEMRAAPATASRFWPFAVDSGVLVKWNFVDQPPAQFRRYDRQGE